MLELHRDRDSSRYRSAERPRLWAVWSAALTPVVLVGGWLIAAAVQPPGYDPVEQTISVLSGEGAAHRWIMTLALFLVAIGYFLTSTGLRAVHPAARTVLLAASIAGFGVALFPQPPTGSTFDHMAFAVAGAALLLAWPFMMAFTRPSVPVPWGDGSSTSFWDQVLSRHGTIAVGVVVAGAVLALFICAQTGAYLGVAERVCTFVQSLPPLLFAVGLRSLIPPSPAPAEAVLGDPARSQNTLDHGALDTGMADAAAPGDTAPDDVRGRAPLDTTALDGTGCGDDVTGRCTDDD